MADFADAQTGGIHEGDHSLLLEVGHGVDQDGNFLFGRDKGEVFIKLTHGKLGIVPWLMKDIKGKKTQL
jgi:hypothetical protein